MPSVSVLGHFKNMSVGRAQCWPLHWKHARERSSPFLCVCVCALGCLAFWSWKRWLSSMYSHWRWMMVILLARRKKKSKTIKDWPRSNSPTPKVICRPGKLMFLLWWDCKGPVVENYMPRGTLSTAKRTVIHLRCIWSPAVWSESHGLLSSGVLIQYANARPHVAISTAQRSLNLRSECLLHPTYLSDLALCDNHISGALREAPGGKKFSTGEDIGRA